MFKKLRRIIRKEGIDGVWQRTRLNLLARVKPEVVRSAYGIDLFGKWEDVTFRLYVRGAYGYFFSKFLKELSDDFIFLDLGANQGLYSIIASKNEYCKHVYSFEPVKSVADIMAKNVELNFCSNVEIRRQAISSLSGCAEVFVDEEHSGATSLRGVSSNDNHHPSKVVIETISAHDLEDLVDVDHNRVIVKIDVEGHEEVVIRELLKCDFFENVSDVFYECDERWVSPDLLQELLSSEGFSNFRKVGRGTHYDTLASRV